MKVWLYYRLSRDEDDELNSLTISGKSFMNMPLQTDMKSLENPSMITSAVCTSTARALTKSMRLWKLEKSRRSLSKTYPAWVDTERRQLCLSTTCGNTMFASSRRRKISIRSTKMTISSLASKVWSTISMRATAAAVCGPATGKSKRKGS